MKTLISVLTLIAIGACNRESGAPVERDAPIEEDIDEEKPERPAAMEEACDEAYTIGTLPEPWFVANPPEQCVESITHDIPELYDDCVSNGASLTGCGAPSNGIIVCQGNGFSDVPRTTQVCRTDAECPEGSACVADELPLAENPLPFSSSQCEKRCTGDGGPAECVRCDMECDIAVGLCRAKRYVRPFEACEHTCQCSRAGDSCSRETGSCFETLAVMDAYRCGDRGTCPCMGGECVDGCCIMPDGHIATPFDAACQRPPP
jgi:hypothetical protein